MNIHEVAGIMHQIVILQVRGAPQGYIDFLAFDLVDSTLIPLLLDILRTHQRSRFRGFAAWALGQIGDKAVLNDLREVDDEDWFVRSCVCEALLLLDPPPPKEKQSKRPKKVKPVQLRLFA